MFLSVSLDRLTLIHQQSEDWNTLKKISFTGHFNQSNAKRRRKTFNVYAKLSVRYLHDRQTNAGNYNVLGFTYEHKNLRPNVHTILV